MNCVDVLYSNDLLKIKRPGIIYFDNLKSLNNPKNNVSFEEFGQLIGKAQKKLIDLKMNSNDSALLFELPSPGLYAIISALLGLGIKVLLVEPWLPVSEINHIIEIVKPKLFIRGFAGKLFSLKVKSIRKMTYHFSSEDFFKDNLKVDPFAIPVDPDHVGILTFTSGTTGKSKGVARTHQYLINQRAVIGKYIDYQDVQKLDLTVFTNLTLMNLALGKGSLIIPKWEKKIISSLNNLPMEYRPDTIATGPHFLNLLHQHVNGKNLNLNTIKLGGALSNINQIEAINQKFTPHRFIHVYGSTEAEPVAFCDMHESLKLSKEREYFQCLYLGKAISEIKTINKETLWVAGPHVSAFYLEDEISNQKNKMKDDNLVYHNMGDRIEIDSNQSLWYQGRDFQTQDDFLLEQKIYNELESSEGFITNIQDEKILVTSVNNKKLVTDIIKKYNLDKFKLVKKIYKDRRHLSRIDRHKTLLKNKMNIKEIK